MAEEEQANPDVARLEQLQQDIRGDVDDAPGLGGPLSRIGSGGDAWTGPVADRRVRDLLDPLVAEYDAALGRLEEVVDEALSDAPATVPDGAV